MEKRPREDTARGWLSASQGERPSEKTYPAGTSVLVFQPPGGKAV